MTPTHLLTWLLEQMRGGRPAGLWTVVSHEGSSPGRRGFMMGVTADAFVGTVGGGVMEATLLREGRACLLQAASLNDGKANKPGLRSLVHRGDAPPETQSGLFCAGKQTQIFCPLGAGMQDVLPGILAAIERGDAVSMTIDTDGLHFEVHGDGVNLGPPIFESHGEVFRYQDFIAPRHTVYIFGGGHVGRALCVALAPLDFRVVCIDDRAEHPLGLHEALAVEGIVAPYDQVRAHVRASSRAYGVVVTAHRDSDIAVLREVVALPFAYLGVMGSAAKVQAIRRALLEAGADEALVGRLRAPIGLPISSESPAEIAVSVAAELIAVRRGAFRKARA